MILRVLDFECTGLTPPEAEVCEVGLCDLTETDAGWWINTPKAWLCAVSKMPPEARAVHHITLEETNEWMRFDPDDVIAGLPDVIVAHNAAYEKLFMGDVFGGYWICTYKAALRVWPDAPGHSNSVLRCWLEDQGLLTLDHEKAMPPHRAGPDAYVTAHILLALLRHATVEQMIEWTKAPRLLPKCPIGKWKGRKWIDIDGSYLSWMLRQDDMAEDIKWNAKRELDRREEESRGLPF